jgi:hypothetical protein
MPEAVAAHRYDRTSSGGLVGRETTLFVLKQFIGMICAALALTGAAEVVISLLTIRDSSFYIGAWYTGLLSFVVGVNGVMLCAKRSMSKLNAKWLCIGAVMCVAFSAFGAAFDGTEYLFFKSLNACATEKTSSSSSETACSTKYHNYSQYDCVGKDAYFIAAASCAISQDVHGDYPYECNCVMETTGNYPCYGFNGFSSCEYLLDDFPDRLHTSYTLCTVIIFLSVIILSLGCRLSYLTQREEYVLFPNILSEPFIDDGMPPTIVQAACEYPEPVIADVTHTPMQRSRENTEEAAAVADPDEGRVCAGSIRRSQEMQDVDDLEEGDCHNGIPIITAVPVNK